MVVVYLSLQCGIVNVAAYVMMSPCGVSMVEVAGAPLVGTIAMFLIVFADKVQVRASGPPHTRPHRPPPPHTPTHTHAHPRTHPATHPHAHPHAHTHTHTSTRHPGFHVLAACVLLARHRLRHRLAWASRQTHFLYQEDLLWSLKAAHLGEESSADTTMWVRFVQFAGRTISKQLPSVFVRSRAVLGMQTALAMLRNESTAVNVQAYVLWCRWCRWCGWRPRYQVHCSPTCPVPPPLPRRPSFRRDLTRMPGKDAAWGEVTGKQGLNLDVLVQWCGGCRARTRTFLRGPLGKLSACLVRRYCPALQPPAPAQRSVATDAACIACHQTRCCARFGLSCDRPSPCRPA